MPHEESPFVRLDETTIIPASITLVPDLYHSGSGSVSVSSGDELDASATASYDLATSWRILGLLEVDLSTSWNVASEVFHWYRVEGECSEVTCEKFKVGYDGCPRMTFVSTIAARNLAELCDTLASPATSAPVGHRISSIRRYSRPVFRDQIVEGQCEVLSDLEFCHVPECLDYCPEGSPTPLIGLHNIIMPEHDVVPPAADGPEEELRQQGDISGFLVARASVSASAAGLGYESDGASSVNDMVPSAGSVSACGCPNIGASIPMRHSLNRSPAVSRFLKSRLLELPSRIDLVYRQSESSWESATHLGSDGEGWVVRFGMACQVDLWRLSLSVRDGRRQTRLVFDVPSEIMCVGTRPSSLIKVYFDRGVTAYDGPVYPVRTPPRKERMSATSSVEIFVRGIFVPQVVYYDELGLFKDSFWDYSPFEMDVNPLSRNPTTLVTLDGIA